MTETLPTAEIDAGCYICQPDNPGAAEEGCSRCDREFWTYAARVDAALNPFCLCGVVDDQGDGTCGNCGRRIMTEDDETRVIPPGADQ